MDWISKSYQHPTVVCGDLNSINGDPVMKFILEGKIDTGNFLGRNFGRFTKDKYLYHTNNLHESYEVNDIPFTNKTPDFCETIDHILYTNETLKLRNVLCGTMDQNQYLKNVKSLPNEWFPSDHIPLLSAFRELREPHHRGRRSSYPYNNYSSSAPARHNTYMNSEQNYGRSINNSKNKNFNTHFNNNNSNMNNNNNNNGFNISHSYSNCGSNNNNNYSSSMNIPINSHIHSSSIPNNLRNNNSNNKINNSNNFTDISNTNKSLLSSSIHSYTEGTKINKSSPIIINNNNNSYNNSYNNYYHYNHNYSNYRYQTNSKNDYYLDKSSNKK